MKHLISIVVPLMLLLSVSCSRQQVQELNYEKNKQELVRVYKKLRSHISIADETGVDSLACYFEEKRHSVHDAMMAQYVWASYCMQKNENQEAYLGLRKLIDRYAHATNEEERDILRCTYSKLQQICRDANDMKLARQWWEQAARSGLYAGDKLYMLYNDRAWIFMRQNELDSCDKYLHLAFENMKKYPDWDFNKEGDLASQMIFFAYRGDDVQYRVRSKVAAQHPYQRVSALDKGFSMMKHGMQDSAKVYFRMAVLDNPVSSKIACIQMAVFAKKHNDIDTLFSYFQKYVTACDSLSRLDEATFAGHLDIVYDNHAKEMKIANQRVHMLAFCLALVVLLLLAIVGWYGTYHYRMRMNAERGRVLLEKQQTVQLEMKLKDALDTYARAQACETEKRKVELQYRFDEVLMKLKRCAEDGCGDRDELFTAIVGLHAEYAPYFSKAITLKYPKASFTDVLLCVLAVHGLSQKEISALLDQDRQKVRSSMVRISKNLNGAPIGRMQDFRTMLEGFIA